MVASSVNVGQQRSVRAPESVNSSDYQNRHQLQIFSEGLSFSGNERDKLWIGGAGPDYQDLSDLSGADSVGDGRAAIAADFDGDGDPDLFVHHVQRERHALLRNDAVRPGEDGHNFLCLRLAASAPYQREAIGATVIVHGPQGPVAQALTRGAGFVSSQPGELIFGLGELDEARVEVTWPGGAREDFGSLDANGRWLLEQESGEARPLEMQRRPLPDPLPNGLRLREGDLVPNIRLLDADGAWQEVDVRALAAGKPLLLNFWASFCSPCVKELPLLVQRSQEGEVAVVAIDVDDPSAHARARALLASAGASFPSFHAPAPPEGDEPAAAQDLPGIEAWVDLERLAIPTTLVLSPEGRVESILRGPLEGQ